jgi:hypothetical protein
MLDVLRVVDMYSIIQLYKDVQRQIVINGTLFIRPENVLEVRSITEEVNGKLLSSYCKTFLELNEAI